MTLFLSSPVVLFPKEYALYAFRLSLDKYELAKPHRPSIQQKIVDSIFFFFFNKKKAQTHVLAGSARVV